MRQPHITLIGGLALALALTAALFAGCASDQESVDIENSAIGVMQTRGTEETSRIVFYDENLEKTGALSLAYATFGGPFYNPLVSQGRLHAIPQGLYDRKDGNKAVAIDLASLAVEEYPIEQPGMNSIATNDVYIWTCNTFNRESFLNRCRMEDGEVESLSIPEEFIMSILWHEDSLYAFAKSMTTNDVSVYRYDIDFNLVSHVDIADRNLSVYRTAAHEDLIYFCGLGADESAGYAGKIGVFDTQANTVGTIDIDGKYPSSIAFHDGRLFVSHYDPFQGSETESPFSVIDLETGAVDRYELGHPVEQIVIRDDSLFVLGGTVLYRYRAADMQLEESTDIEMMPGDFSYLSGLFAMPENGKRAEDPTQAGA